MEDLALWVLTQTLPYEFHDSKHCYHTVVRISTSNRNLIFLSTQVFQKGSPIVRDFSQAILKLAENGIIRTLEDEWLTPQDECSDNIASSKPESLGLQSFQVLYIVSFATSTICLLLSLILLPISPQQHQDASDGNVTPDEESAWKKAVRFVRYCYIKNRGRAPTLADTSDAYECSSRWQFSSIFDTPEHVQSSPPVEIEMQWTIDCKKEAQRFECYLRY